MSPKYAKMPSPPKTEEDRSRLSTNGKSQENPMFNAGTWTSSAVKKRQEIYNLSRYAGVYCPESS